jgi:hypothetical protein
MSRTVSDPVTMSRLAFVRLLYLQGVTQAQLPEPLNFTSVLTFHDAVELFLVLAADHLRAPLPRRDPNFLEYWQVLRPTATFTDGVELSGHPGMDRLNRHRNALKHAGAMPSRAAVEDVRASTTSFLEDNTPRVFAIDFAAIDMADVVAQPDTRAKLKAAADAEAAADRAEAMGDLAEAFSDLFSKNLGFGSAYGFGQTIQDQPFVSINSMISTLVSGGIGRPQDRRAAQGAAGKLDRQLKNITEVVTAMQRGMRILALGIDYAQYDRFERLTPLVLRSGERRTVHAPPNYAPTREEYDYCVQFVISVALRMAELDVHTARPSWTQQT